VSPALGDESGQRILALSKGGRRITASRISGVPSLSRTAVTTRPRIARRRSAEGEKRGKQGVIEHRHRGGGARLRGMRCAAISGERNCDTIVPKKNSAGSQFALRTREIAHSTSSFFGCSFFSGSISSVRVWLDSRPSRARVIVLSCFPSEELGGRAEPARAGTRRFSGFWPRLPQSAIGADRGKNRRGLDSSSSGPVLGPRWCSSELRPEQGLITARNQYGTRFPRARFDYITVNSAGGG